MSGWNMENIPHKDWKYVGIEDRGEGLYPGESIKYEQCDMCSEKLRYVHILEHPEFNGILRVGCDCAAKLTNDYVKPKETERNYKYKINRRNNFLRQEWIYKRETGNYTLQYKGERITIMKSKYGTGWGIMFRKMPIWEYRGEKIKDLETAKLVAFEIFDEA